MKKRRSPRLHKRKGHTRNGQSIKPHFVGKKSKRIIKTIKENISTLELQRRGLKVGTVIPDIGGVEHTVTSITPVPGIPERQDVVFVSTGF